MKENIPEMALLPCEVCSEETEHEVLKGRIVKKGAGLEGVFKCTRCGTIEEKLVDLPVPKEVSVIISQHEKTIKKKATLPPGMYRVDDEFYLDEMRCSITRIDAVEGRVERAELEDVECLWTKDISTVKVKISVNAGEETFSYVYPTGPEHTFSPNEIIEVEPGTYVRVKEIKYEGRQPEDGGIEAKNIVRIYGKFARRR